MSDGSEKDEGSVPRAKVLAFKQEKKPKPSNAAPQLRRFGAASKGNAKGPAGASRERVAWKRALYLALQFGTVAFAGWLVLKSCGGR